MAAAAAGAAGAGGGADAVDGAREPRREAGGEDEDGHDLFCFGDVGVGVGGVGWLSNTSAQPYREGANDERPNYKPQTIQPRNNPPSTHLVEIPQRRVVREVIGEQARPECGGPGVGLVGEGVPVGVCFCFFWVVLVGGLRLLVVKTVVGCVN